MLLVESAAAAVSAAAAPGAVPGGSSGPGSVSAGPTELPWQPTPLDLYTHTHTHTYSTCTYVRVCILCIWTAVANIYNDNTHVIE